MNYYAYACFEARQPRDDRGRVQPRGRAHLQPERDIVVDNLLVRVHWIVEMIVVERPCAMGV